MRVVGTLTTIPSRLEHIENVLQIIKNQTRPLDQIYLTVPKVSLKGTNYPEVPKSYEKYCKIVRIERDYGPVTKILGALYEEYDPNTIFISFDDDWNYSDNIVESLLQKIPLYPDAALGVNGFCVGKFPFLFAGKFQFAKGEWYQRPGGSKVDVLCGYSAVLYHRKFFPKKEDLEQNFLKCPLEHKSLLYHDDVYISSYLSSQDIDRMVIDFEEPEHYNLQDGLSDNKIRFWTKFFAAIFVAWRVGLLHPVTVKSSETISGPFVFALIIIALSLFLVLILYFVFPGLFLEN